jgi:5-formyltetrahydrofolate cyclo-ligase
MELKEKAAIRKQILARRDNIPVSVKKVKDKAIEDRLFALGEIRQAITVFLFASFRSEADTSGMIRRFLREGKTVILPRVEGATLGLYRITSPDELLPGYMKIPEPSVLTSDRMVRIDDVDAIVVPGAVYDISGNRIGYGGGFYDRLLAQLQKPVPVIAPAYEEQVIDAVPAEPHDRKVGIIVTDRRTICIHSP